MPAPEKQAALSDVKTAMDTALESSKGINLPFDDKKSRYSFKMRCYQLRTKLRQEAEKIYPAGTPGHGESEYDSLVLRDITMGPRPALFITKSDTIEVDMFDAVTGEKL